MFDRGNGRNGQVSSAIYSENQIEATINELGIQICGETMNDFQCLCPFHGNTNTPSFSVSKTSGKFLCFNMACGEFGSLIELVKSQRTDLNDFAAARIINKATPTETKSFKDRFAELVNGKEMPKFDVSTVDRLSESLWHSPEAIAYLRERGFSEETLKSYRVGYSEKRRVIAVPMFDIKGFPVGFVGRKIDRKQFDNSKKIPVRQTLWNIHRAIRTGSDTVILCESTFDAMIIAQSGYPNVVACIGGNFNEIHAEMIKRHFNAVVIFTDWDDSSEHVYDKLSEGKKCTKCRKIGYTACKGHNPGRDLGEKVVSLMKGKSVLWASYEYGMVYPLGVKDAGDMSEEQIRRCIQNAVPNMEYQRWNIYYQRDYEKRLALMDY